MLGIPVFSSLAWACAGVQVQAKDSAGMPIPKGNRRGQMLGFQLWANMLRLDFADARNEGGGAKLCLAIQERG